MERSGWPSVFEENEQLVREAFQKSPQEVWKRIMRVGYDMLNS